MIVANVLIKGTSSNQLNQTPKTSILIITDLLLYPAIPRCELSLKNSIIHIQHGGQHVFICLGMYMGEENWICANVHNYCKIDDCYDVTIILHTYLIIIHCLI